MMIYRILINIITTSPGVTQKTNKHTFTRSHIHKVQRYSNGRRTVLCLQPNLILFQSTKAGDKTNPNTLHNLSHEERLNLPDYFPSPQAQD